MKIDSYDFKNKMDMKIYDFCQWWAEEHLANPTGFPESMEFEEWFEHFLVQMEGK